MKKKIVYPILTLILISSLSAFYFNATKTSNMSKNSARKSRGNRNANGYQLELTENTNLELSNDASKIIENNIVELSYDADMRLVLRNNLRTFTQNILHAYLPETIEWPRRDIINKKIDRSFLRNIFFRGWCYEGQTKRLFLDDLKLNFPSEDRYTIKFLDNNRIYLKIDYQSTPLLTGKIKYELFPNRSKWQCDDREKVPNKVWERDINFPGYLIELDLTLTQMEVERVEGISKDDPDLLGFQGGLRVQNINEFKVSVGIGNVFTEATLDNAGELDLDLNILADDESPSWFQGGDFTQFIDWYIITEKEYACEIIDKKSEKIRDSKQCNYFTNVCPTYNQCVKYHYLSSLYENKQSFEDKMIEIIDRKLQMFGPRGRTITYGDQKFDMKFKLSDFSTNEAEEYLSMTWNLNYNSKQKFGEICGKDLNFPSNDGFDELSDSSADFQIQASNRSFVNLFKVMAQSGILCQFFSKKITGDELIKFKPIFSGDFIFEPYDEFSKLEGAQIEGIKLVLPFRLGYYSSEGEFINLSADQTISGELVLKYETVQSCGSLTLGLKSFAIENLEGTMELSATAENPILEGSTFGNEFKESWETSFQKSFGRISLSPKIVTIPGYEKEVSVGKPKNENVRKSNREEKAFMFAVSEYSPIDNSISFGVTASEVDPIDLCCNEYGYIDCSPQIDGTPIFYDGALNSL